VNKEKKRWRCDRWAEFGYVYFEVEKEIRAGPES